MSSIIEIETTWLFFFFMQNELQQVISYTCSEGLGQIPLSLEREAF